MSNLTTISVKAANLCYVTNGSQDGNLRSMRRVSLIRYWVRAYCTPLRSYVKLRVLLSGTVAISIIGESRNVFQEIARKLCFGSSPKGLLHHVRPQKLRRIYVGKTDSNLLRTEVRRVALHFNWLQWREWSYEKFPFNGKLNNNRVPLQVRRRLSPGNQFKSSSAKFETRMNFSAGTYTTFRYKCRDILLQMCANLHDVFLRCPADSSEVCGKHTESLNDLSSMFTKYSIVRRRTVS